MMELTQEQKEKIKEYVKGYFKWFEKDENLKDHKEHHSFFMAKLAEESINKMNEDDLREIYKQLWASNIWGNKDWYVENKLLAPNGLEKIKKELIKLLYGKEEISVRFDEFKKNVKGFGPSSISEILHFVFPEKYCLWNDKPKTVLPFLRINILPEKLFIYNLQTGLEYQQCINALSIIKNELAQNGFKEPDFIDLDCFLWYVFNTIDFSVDVVKEEKILQKELTLKIDSHEKAEEIVLKLGKMLGYTPYLTKSDRNKIEDKELLNEIYTEIPDFTGERDKSSAREIDVIWFDESENPKFCLEIEHSTDVTKGLSRLSQLKQFDVKFVIVAPEEKRNKFETEMEKWPYRQMQDKFKFVSYKELIEIYDVLVNFKQMMSKLFGE